MSRIGIMGNLRGSFLSRGAVMGLSQYHNPTATLGTRGSAQVMLGLYSQAASHGAKGKVRADRERAEALILRGFSV
jgi:hypothetical protein